MNVLELCVVDNGDPKEEVKKFSDEFPQNQDKMESNLLKKRSESRQSWLVENSKEGRLSHHHNFGAAVYTYGQLCTSLKLTKELLHLHWYYWYWHRHPRY